MTEKISYQNLENRENETFPIGVPLSHNLSDEDRENISHAPFFLIEEDNGNVHLLKRYSAQRLVPMQKQIRINILIYLKKLPSLAEVLLDVIETKEWFYLPTEESLNIAQHAISCTFLTQDPFLWSCSKSERLSIFSQTETKMRYQTAIEPDFYQKQLYYRQNHVMPTPEELARFCIKNKNNIPTKPVHSFSSSIDLLYWLISELAARDAQILKCPNCNRLFYRESGKVKYCSTKCSKEANKTGKFCGDNEIKASYNRIYQLFEKRRKQGVGYILPEKIDETTQRLFAVFLGSHRGVNEIFDAEDIGNIRKKYLAREKKKNAAFREAFKKYRSQAITENEYIAARDEFQMWLNDFEHFIRSFKAE